MPLPDGPYGDITDAEYWEYQRALQQAATDAAREANLPKDSHMPLSDDEAVQAHLARQVDCPDGFVRLDDGRIRPVGGNDDNASPQRGAPDYLPDPPGWEE